MKDSGNLKWKKAGNWGTTQTLRRLLKSLPDFLKHPLCGFWFLVIQFWVCLSSSPSTKINGRAWANERSTKAVNLWGKKDTINILAQTKRVIKWLFHTTERFLARWLVENNRWEHRPRVKKMTEARRAVSLSRVRDLPRNFNKNVIVKNKSITISIVFTIIDHRKAIKMFKTLRWNHFSMMNILTSFVWSIRL